MANLQTVAGRNTADATIQRDKWQNLFLREAFIKNTFRRLMGRPSGNLANSNGAISVLTNWQGDVDNVELSIPMSSQLSDITYKQITNITGTETGVLTTAQKIKWTYVHRAIGRDFITHISDLYNMDNEAIMLLLDYYDRLMSRTIVNTFHSPILTGKFGVVSSSSSDTTPHTPFVNDPDDTADSYLQRNADRIIVPGENALTSSSDWADVKAHLAAGSAKTDNKITIAALDQMQLLLDDPDSPSHIVPVETGTLMREPRYRVIMSRQNADTLRKEFLKSSGIMNFANEGSRGMFSGSQFDWGGFSFYANSYFKPIATVKTDQGTAANRIMDPVFVGGNNMLMYAMKVSPVIQRETQQYGNVVGWNLLAAGGTKLVGIPGNVEDAKWANFGIICARYQG